MNINLKATIDKLNEYANGDEYQQATEDAVILLQEQAQEIADLKIANQDLKYQLIQKAGEQVLNDFKPPNKWTDEEIKNGYKGIRWIALDGVHGIPTHDDVVKYLGYPNHTRELTDEEILEVWKENYGDVNISNFARAILKKASEK
jgi:hypothetical protein